MSYKITRLPNGLRLITAPLHETQAVTVLVLVKVGSRYEPRNLNGASHFIEHMMFKGTERRPKTLDLSQELDAFGAEYNAFTAKDHTGYYIKVQGEKFDLALDVLADMLFCSKFEGKEIERERGTITEEINMYEDNPMLYAPAFLEETLFGQSSQLGQLIIGSKNNIKKITRPEMIGYKEKFYNSSNTVVAVCGDIKEEKALKLLKKYFGGHKKGVASSYQKISFKRKGPIVALKQKDTSQVQLCLGFLGYSYFEKDRYALELLNVLLGGNMSSRLFIEVRERHGLCYFIRSAVSPYEDTGSFIIQAGLDKERIDEAIKVIARELKKIIQDGVGKKELDKAKDYIKGRVILDFEDSSEIAEFYGRQLLLLGEIKSLEERIREIEKVKLAAVSRAAKDILNFKNSALALIGPFRDKNHFLRLLK